MGKLNLQEAKVLVGDSIVEVNGIEEPEDMLQEIKVAKVLRMQLLRAQAGLKGAFKELKGLPQPLAHVEREVRMCHMARHS